MKQVEFSELTPFGVFDVGGQELGYMHRRTPPKTVFRRLSIYRHQKTTRRP
jgi:hypothetical protein